MDVVLDGGCRADEHDLVFKKRAVAVVMLPVGGHENFVERMGLIGIAWTKTEHASLARGRNAISAAEFSERSRVERLVDCLPWPRRNGIEAVEQTIDLQIRQRVMDPAHNGVCRSI